jgi:signal recognition particle GTPase
MENNEDVKTTEEKVEETTQKTYTVEDVNNSYKAGVKKARAELEQSEEYKKYQDWIKSNQNDSEKIKNLENSNADKDNIIKDLKAQLCLSKSDVKPEFMEFVTSKVISMSDETTTFEEALKNFKKSSPQYFGETVVKKVQTSPGLNNGGNQPQTTNQVMNDLLRGTRK